MSQVTSLLSNGKVLVLKDFCEVQHTNYLKVCWAHRCSMFNQKKESLSYVVTLWFYTNYIYLYTIFNQFHGPTPFFDPILNQGPLVDIHYFIVGVEKIQTRNTRLDGVAPSVVRKKWGKYFLKANLAILSLHLYVSGRPVHKLGCSYSFIGGMIPMELAMQPWLVTCTEVS